MLNRRHFGIALVFGVLTPLPAFAGNIKPFSQAEFAAAQKAGKSILIDISASWCPTCKAQAPIIHSLIKSEKFKNVVTFQVDFDAQVDVVQAFGAQQQSTLIAFKGEAETARSVGDTTAASIEALLASSI